MSGGIARGRLAEERKSWRKNHPHVRTHQIVVICLSFVLRFDECFCVNSRVSWQSLRRCRTVR